MSKAAVTHNGPYLPEILSFDFNVRDRVPEGYESAASAQRLSGTELSLRSVGSSGCLKTNTAPRHVPSTAQEQLEIGAARPVWAASLTILSANPSFFGQKHILSRWDTDSRKRDIEGWRRHHKHSQRAGVRDCPSP